MLVIDSNNNKVGIISITEALQLANNEGLDLVQVSSNDKLTVCKIIDYSKYLYEQKKKSKDNFKKSKTNSLKEIKLKPRIEKHDYDFKLKNIIDFLKKGHKVKITICFTGREINYMDIGLNLLDKLKQDVSEYCNKISENKTIGRFISINVDPKK